MSSAPQLKLSERHALLGPWPLHLHEHQELSTVQRELTAQGPPM